jgi:sulfur-carrier protein
VVRHHVAVFVDGDALRDKRDLSQPLRPGAEVYVMQALSGG